MNMFIKRIAWAAVVAVNAVVAFAALLVLLFGPLGLFFALGTWPVPATLAFLIALVGR